MIKRFTAIRKARILNTLHDGAITRDQLKERYEMSEDELQEWERGYEDGVRGLHVTGRAK